jgi:hypothetical protein
MLAAGVCVEHVYLFYSEIRDNITINLLLAAYVSATLPAFSTTKVQTFDISRRQFGKI